MAVLAICVLEIPISYIGFGNLCNSIVSGIWCDWNNTNYINNKIPIAKTVKKLI